MLETIKSINKQLIEQLDEIQLPNTKKFLIKIGNIENDNNLMCTFCNNWVGKNKSSLAAHIRNCKINVKNKDTETSIEQLSEENMVIKNTNDKIELIIQTNITETTPIKKSKKKNDPKNNL